MQRQRARNGADVEAQAQEFLFVNQVQEKEVLNGAERGGQDQPPCRSFGFGKTEEPASRETGPTIMINGELIDLVAGDYEARIATSGATLVHLRRAGSDLVIPYIV